MPARAIMIMGTGSDVGKSLIVAGLCRHFANAGYRVAHGLFTSDAFRRAWLASFEEGEVPPHPCPLSQQARFGELATPRGRIRKRMRRGRGERLLNGHAPPPLPWREKDRMRGDSPLSYDALIEQTLDDLAAHLAQHIDMEALLKLAR